MGTPARLINDIANKTKAASVKETSPAANAPFIVRMNSMGRYWPEMVFKNPLKLV